MRTILHSRVFYYALLMLLAAILPHLAFAQAATGGSAVGFPFQVDDNDLSKKIIIDYLFGPISPGAADPQNPVGALLGTFSAICLAIGGVLVAYTLFAGTLVTAHEGQILGKKWSSLWLPLRITMGSAILIPVKGMGGFCVLQAIVVWLALQGIGAANTVWSAYLHSDPMTNIGVFDSAGLDQQANTLANQLAFASICLAVENKTTISNDSDPGAVNINGNLAAALKGTGSAPTPSTSGTNNSRIDTKTYTYGSSCGSVSFANPNSTILTSGSPLSSQTTSSNFIQRLFAVSGGVYNNTLKANVPTNEALIANVNADAFAIVAAYNNPKNPDSHQLYVTALKKMDADIQTYRTSYVNQIKATAQSNYESFMAKYHPYDTLAQDGWSMAGAYYIYFLKVINAIDSATHQLPVYNQPTSPEWTRACNQSMDLGFTKFAVCFYDRHAVEPVKGFFGGTNSQAQFDILSKSLTIANDLGVVSPSRTVDSIGVTDPTYDIKVKSSSDVVNRIVGTFGSFGFSQALSDGANTSGFANPILLMSNIGNTMLSISWYVLIIGAVAGVLNFTVSGVALGLFTSLALPGASLAYALPLFPFLMWMGAFFGWVVMLVEAVVAAPLWALAHLFPDGDGIVGRAGQGYMLVLSLMLKPALMIIGLIFALVIMSPVGKMINLVFLTACNAIGFDAYGNAIGGIDGIVASIVGLFIYTGLMYKIIFRIFDLIHVIPDTVLTWLGAPGAKQLGEGASMAGDAYGAYGMGKMGAAAQVAGTAGRGAAGLAGALGGPARHFAGKALGAKSANLAASTEKVNSMRADASGRMASAEQAGAYANVGTPADRERGANKLMEASMDQSVAQSATASNKSKDVGFNSTGVKALDSVSTGLSQRQIRKGAGYAANRQHLIDNLRGLENKSNGSPNSIAAINNAKSALDKFDESAMDVMKKHVAANHGDTGGLSAAAASVYAASQHRDDRNTAKLERLGGSPGRGGGEVSANMKKANDAMAAAVKADPSIAAKASSMGGVEKFLGAVQNNPSLASPVAKPYLDSARQHHSTAQSLADEFSATAKSMGMSDADISATRPSVAFQEPSPTGDLFG